VLLDPRFENPHQQKIWNRAERKPSVAACPVALRPRIAGSIVAFLATVVPSAASRFVMLAAVGAIDNAPQFASA